MQLAEERRIRGPVSERIRERAFDGANGHVAAPCSLAQGPIVQQALANFVVTEALDHQIETLEHPIEADLVPRFGVPTRHDQQPHGVPRRKLDRWIRAERGGKQPLAGLVSTAELEDLRDVSLLPLCDLIHGRTSGSDRYEFVIDQGTQGDLRAGDGRRDGLCNVNEAHAAFPLLECGEGFDRLARCEDRSHGAHSTLST